MGLVDVARDTVRRLFGSPDRVPDPASAPGAPMGSSPYLVDVDWPPKDVEPHWEQIKGYRRRYENDRAVMLQHSPDVNVDPSRRETYLPVPLPRKMARFSTSMLFASEPSFNHEEKQDEMDRLFEVNDMPSLCLKAGERVAAEGILGLRIIRDSAVNEDGVPLITVLPEDQAIWDIRHGDFVLGGIAVIESKPDPGKSDLYRLLEKHTAGQVTRKLYKGTDSTLGKEVPLDSVEEFASLEAEEETGLNVPTLIRWENVPGGASDFYGIEGLLDTLNEAESLFLDKARKSIPQVFVDRSLLDERGRVELQGYHITGGDNRISPVLGTDPKNLVETVQPRFDSSDHIQYIEHLEKLIIMMAGYSMASFNGLGPREAITRAVSGYALKLAQVETLLTRSGKSHMAKEVLAQAVGVALGLMTGEGDVSTLLPTIELGDGLPSDPLEIAQQVNMLHAADAASLETLVGFVHEGWTNEEIAEEVAKIKEEQEVLNPKAVTHPPNTFIGPEQGQDQSPEVGPGPLPSDTPSPGERS